MILTGQIRTFGCTRVCFRVVVHGQECLVLFKGPSDVAVEEVHAILRQIVARTLESEECKGLAQYGQLKREIATTGAAALESMKEDARKMVLTMVEMERSYLTAEVFREILQQNGRSGEGGEVMRTLSGRQVCLTQEHTPILSCNAAGQGQVPSPVGGDSIIVQVFMW